MEIPNTVDSSGKEVSLPPAAYERFAMRRLFWREFGLRYDEVTHREVQETMVFHDLERQHPYRQQRAQREANDAQPVRGRVN